MTFADRFAAADLNTSRARLVATITEIDATPDLDNRAWRRRIASDMLATIDRRIAARAAWGFVTR